MVRRARTGLFVVDFVGRDEGRDFTVGVGLIDY